MRVLYSPRRPEAGWSLVEILVVILIMGLLAAIVVPSVRGAAQRQRDRDTIDITFALGQSLRDISIQYPRSTAQKFRVTNSGDSVTVFIDVNGDNIPNKNSDPMAVVGKSRDMQVAIHVKAPGDYDVYAWNPNGKTYTSQSKAVKWSRSSGKVSDSHQVSPVGPSS